MDQDTDQPLDPKIEAILPVLRAAHEHHQAGRLDEAAALYDKVLLEVPGLGDPLHLLGQIALARGQAHRAAELISQAIEDLPEEFAEPQLNLGNAFVALRQFAEAEACYRRALVIDPDLAEAHSNLAGVLNEQGKHAEAAESASAAVLLAPGLAKAHLNQAAALRPLRRYDEAEAALRQALTLEPNRAATWMDLANVLGQLRRDGEAVPLHEKALELQPNDPMLHSAFAATLVRLGHADAAIAHATRATELAPKWSEAWMWLGGAELALGRFDDAQSRFRRALELDPDRVDAHWNLMFTGRQSGGGPERALLEAKLARPDMPVSDRIAAGFSLGKMCDDADEYDAAFAAYADANKLLRAERAALGQQFDGDALTKRIDRLISDHPPGVFRLVVHWGNGSELPVFVVGMPRSGTTLVEQIAASHSQVFGAGELPHIQQIGRAMGEHNRGRRRMVDWDPMHARQQADRHLRHLRELGGVAARVIDKAPDNVFMVGLIGALYPGARIIVVERDLRDCCLSNYFQFFTNGNVFSFDLHDCGVRARETARLVKHWQQILPHRLMTIQYEDLVADLEGNARRLIDFLGLEWEPACLDFHRTERAVLTASQWQVRQPIYTRSAGRWQHYEKHLEPLLAGLRGERRA